MQTHITTPVASQAAHFTCEGTTPSYPLLVRHTHDHNDEGSCDPSIQTAAQNNAFRGPRRKRFSKGRVIVPAHWPHGIGELAWGAFQRCMPDGRLSLIPLCYRDRRHPLSHEAK